MKIIVTIPDGKTAELTAIRKAPPISKTLGEMAHLQKRQTGRLMYLAGFGPCPGGWR